MLIVEVKLRKMNHPSVYSSTKREVELKEKKALEKAKISQIVSKQIRRLR